MSIRKRNVDAVTVSAIVRRRSTNDELRDIIVRQARQISSLRMIIRHLHEQQEQDRTK